ncbi:hypothetical protein FLM48_02820 [Shewanella sp. Scap07]|uniref:hypothetical protein n=1 Tax=Shewanella sp. Scap07 TaxID=2589987 RepID=UPI0015BA3CA9|nr:hypothetical protein [Shewanella sp. Scap07]QLE84111.1 hypothetical protein FLM48_02820 [Shewanella sp. Scap07]
MNKTGLISIAVVAVSLAAVALYSQQEPAAELSSTADSPVSSAQKPAPSAQTPAVAAKVISAPVSQTAPVEQRPSRVVNEDGFEQQVVQQRQHKAPVPRPDAPSAQRAPTQPPHSPEDYAYHKHQSSEQATSAPVSRPMPKPEQ